MRRFLAPLFSCAVLAAGAPAPLAGRDAPLPSGPVTLAPGSVVPGGDLAPVRVRHYRMAGRVRPLLFWFGRDNVGMARLVWRRGEAGARGYEMLVGTDPARAPRATNRWGFIAEQVDGDDGALLALMTRADEANYDEAAAAGASGDDFRAIRASVRDGVARWQVSRVKGTAPLTVRDLDAAVVLVRDDARVAAPRQMPVVAGTRPGFLGSVAELLGHALVAPGGAPASGAGTLRYVFGERLYELRVRQVRRVTAPLGQRQVPALHAAFEIRTLATGTRTAFEITSGTEGDLAGVPLLIQWQPRWWLKVELHLEDGGLRPGDRPVD